MKNFIRSAATIIVAANLSSCTYIERFNYKPTEIAPLARAPKMEVKNFFNGDLEVFAITQDSGGKIIGSYTAKMSGKWEDNKGVLQQNFINEIGKKDSRTWLITLDSTDGTFNAIGHDVVAPVKGKQAGNALQMIYALTLSEDGKKQEINYEDNIYLVEERSAIGVSLIRKDGMSFGKSIISYKKIGKND
jgi:hypothetical protein